MHEMSIAQSILHMALEEAKKQNCNRLISVKIDCGILSGIMPEALLLCFEALVKDTPHSMAKLEIEKIPLKLRCSFCNYVFGEDSQNALYMPCPKCGENFGLMIETGKELILSKIEAMNSQ